MAKGMMDLGAVDWSGINLAPEPAPAPPPPPPAPAPAANPRYEQLTAAGGESMFGNRMDTAAGRAREAEMRAAEAALIVAQSEAAHGRSASAEAALRQMDRHVANINATGNTPTGFNAGLAAAEAKTFPDGRPTAPPPKVDPGPGPGPGSGSGEGSAPASFFSSPVASTPPPPPPPVKDPGRDVITFARNDLSPSGITNLLLEAIGGVEASTIARRDTVEGQNPYYGAISNVATIRKEYDATKLISRQTSNESIFDIYAIDLNSKIPGDIYLSQRNLENFFYIADNGDFIIEFDNIIGDEEIQLEIAGGGTIKMVSES